LAGDRPLWYTLQPKPSSLAPTPVKTAAPSGSGNLNVEQFMEKEGIKSLSELIGVARR